MIKTTLFVFCFILVSSVAYAANFTADARGLDEYGNWVPLKVDSNGYLLVVGGAA